jgi:hypothetical protein
MLFLESCIHITILLKRSESMVYATCLKGENKAERIVHREFGLIRPAVMMNGITRSENRISLKFRLVLDQDKEPFTGWMEGIVENFKQTGVLFRTVLPEDTIDLLIERPAQIYLLIKLPGTGRVIVSVTNPAYFKRCSACSDGSTVMIGVEFKGLVDHEKADILEFLDTGFCCR